MPGDNLVKFKLDGDEFEIDMDDLTLDEVGTVEDMCGKSAEHIDWESARGIQGLIWIAMHRRNPRFTLEDAGRIKFSQMGKADEKRPTKAAPRREKSGASSSSKA